jgi:ribosome biogenesis GTPase A
MNLPAEKGSLLVLVLDVWDFHGSALSVALKSILNRRPPRPSMLVVINKADLLPSTVKQERVLSWARKELRKAAAAGEERRGKINN